MKTICEPKMSLNRNAEFPWNVQLWHSYDGGKTFVYAGIGKFFKDSADANAYSSEHRTPLHVFPIITPKLQKAYEEAATSEGTPDICGYRGRACRQMSNEEGANRALCMGCRLAEFCHADEMDAYAKS